MIYVPIRESRAEGLSGNQEDAYCKQDQRKAIFIEPADIFSHI